MIRIISKNIVSGGFVITVDPSITKIPIRSNGDKKIYGGPEDVKNIAQQVITKYFNSIDPIGNDFMGARYVFNVSKISDEIQYVMMTIRILPKTKKPGQEKPLDPENYMYDYYMKYHGGKSGKTIYKSPKDAVGSIPVDPNLAYRGMAWEEWQSIRKSGIIRSRGVYNLGDQQVNLTLFSPNPETALYYAHGFAPIQYQVSAMRPGVVIAIPKQGLLTHNDFPAGVPGGELALRRELPASKIEHVWMMVATESSNKGFMEFLIPWVPAWNLNTYKDPNMGVFELGVDKVRSGSGDTSVVTGYVVRQLK